jgi:hypothetical protein
MGADIGDYPSRYVVARRVWDETFGPIGLAALAGGASMIPLARRSPDVVRDDAARLTRWCFLSIGILGCAVYLRMPYESGYLLAPAIFGVAWVGMQLPRRFLFVLAGLLLASPHFDPIDGDPFVERDARYRRRVAEAASAMPTAARAIARPATVVTGFLTPPWQYSVGDTASVRVVASISAAEMAELRSREERVYYIPTIAAWHRRRHGVDLAAAGASPMPTTDAVLLGGLDFQN